MPITRSPLLKSLRMNGQSTRRSGDPAHSPAPLKTARKPGKSSEYVGAYWYQPRNDIARFAPLPCFNISIPAPRCGSVTLMPRRGGMCSISLPSNSYACVAGQRAKCSEATHLPTTIVTVAGRPRFFILHLRVYYYFPSTQARSKLHQSPIKCQEAKTNQTLFIYDERCRLACLAAHPCADLGGTPCRRTR
jgi:hypothetical protein